MVTPSEPHRRKAARPRGRTPLSVEELESRLAPSIYTVQGTGDPTGTVSPVSMGVFTAPTLRAAVDAANLAGGTNTIDLRRRPRRRRPSP